MTVLHRRPKSQFERLSNRGSRARQVSRNLGSDSVLLALLLLLALGGIAVTIWALALSLAPG